MEIKSAGRNAVVGDLKGGELVWAQDRNAIMVKPEGGGFAPKRDAIDVATGERIEIDHRANVTVYDKAKVVLE